MVAEQYDYRALAEAGILKRGKHASDLRIHESRRRVVSMLNAGMAPSHLERLVQVKNSYDPTNLFRLNSNIEPTV